MSELTGTTPRVPAPWWQVVLAAAVWLGLWGLTPGLLARGPGSLVSSDAGMRILVETLLALVLAVVLGLAHRRYNRVLFARSWAIWLYVLPLVLAVTVLFRYEGDIPVALYLFWMTVSVFWQDYLTFGLLQSYLGERLRPVAVIVTSAVLFWLGHVLFLPNSFGLAHLVPSLAILALGLALASLRVWLGTLHLLLALHLSFYFVFLG